MAAATITTVDAALKQLYPQKRLPELTFQKHPFWGIVKKRTDFGGRNAQISNQFAPTAGGSADFSVALTRKQGAAYEDFVVTRKKDYSVWSIDTETVRATKGDAMALGKAVEKESMAAWNTIRRSISISLFRNGGGARGLILSGGGTTTLQLANRADARFFEKNMWIDSDTTDGTSGAVAGFPLQITGGVDRVLGRLTRSAGNWNAGGGYGDGHYLFRDGDFGAMLSGLDAWLPATVTSTSFYGVDRTQDSVRLGGVRYTANAITDSTIERTLVNASAETGLQGDGTCDVVIVNPLTWGKLNNEIGSKTEYTIMPAQSHKGTLASIGYKTIELMGAGGPMKIIADGDCPTTLAYMLQLDTWTLATLGEGPGWIDEDGNRMLREGSADAIEGRLGFFGNLWCENPGANCRIDLTAVL
jgi:hypothetical protein